MPAALPSMWRAVKRGYTAEPWLLLIAFVLTICAAMPDALFALWLMLLANGLLQDNPVYTWIGALGLGLSATLTWALRVVSDRTQRRFRDRVSIALESHVAQLQASVATIAHHERPEYLDRLTVLRDQVFTLDHMYHSMFATVGWFIRLGITGALLYSVHPSLLLLALAALPTVVSSTTRPGVERKIEEQNAPASRLSKHLFDIATTASPGKEVRLSNIGNRIVRDRHQAWRRWYEPIARARWHTAGISVVAWSIFGAGYVGAVVFTVYVLAAPPGAALLVLAAGSRLAAYISATVGELGFLRGIWMDGAKRLAWLEDYSNAMTTQRSDPVPTTLEHGITFEHVTFCYPGTEKPALENVSFHIDAGSVVALVGENGAGKTTLVKLLAGMYEPTAGRILIDGKDLNKMDPIAWRERLSGAFQDFFQFELVADQTVGIGDQPRIENRPAVETAVSRAGAEDVLDQLPSGLDTQLGPTWKNGVEVSFGQWQKLSLARGFMRDEPLLLMLDEPTAALDAETEHALFERYASAAQHNDSTTMSPTSGRITMLVSHRFSTVRMANQIVVMEGSHMVECGSHEELMASGMQYAELYEIQASSYR
ncbi:MAG: ABC transporter ATP-binding protein [Gammaproteobacteria bacterium]|nr:ABC transporter ATP-binding protein [Gammaproteobacteria bacterium]MYD79047.1 ABC transporter ATP-binding protein [Gammaproteobacteria bacterium]